MEGVDVPHNNALVMMVSICNYDVKRVLIDTGSSSNVMYLNAYNQLHRFNPKKTVRTVDALIYSLNGQPVRPICIVDVLVGIGEVTTNMKFFVLNINSPYNAILGRNLVGGDEGNGLFISPKAQVSFL